MSETFSNGYHLRATAGRRIVYALLGVLLLLAASFALWGALIGFAFLLPQLRDATLLLANES